MDEEKQEQPWNYDKTETNPYRDVKNMVGELTLQLAWAWLLGFLPTP